MNDLIEAVTSWVGSLALKVPLRATSSSVTTEPSNAIGGALVNSEAGQQLDFFFA